MLLNIKKMIPWLVFPWVIAVSMPCSGEVALVVLATNTSAVVGQAHHNASAVAETSLQDQKLLAEIKELQLKSSPLARYGSLVTMLLALVTLGATVWKSWSEYVKNRLGRINEDQRRQDENLRRADERLSVAVAQIAAKASLATNMLGATSLLIFLREEYRHLHEQVFHVVLTALRVNELPSPVKKILVKGMKKAMQVVFDSSREVGKVNSDWTKAYLKRIELKDINFRRVDFAFSDMRRAQMNNCNFQEAKFHGADLKYANFNGANFVSARLDNADLRNTKFSNTSLQDAIFGKAQLHGALFYNANLKATKFCNCDIESFGDASLKSILDSCNNTWKKAWFEQDVWEKLFELNDSNLEREKLTKEEMEECLKQKCKKVPSGGR